jgi:hypothetical protein
MADYSQNIGLFRPKGGAIAALSDEADHHWAQQQI